MKLEEAVKWTVTLWVLGEVVYSYQLVGFYYMLRVFNAPLSRLWLPLLVNGLRFILQSLTLLGVLTLILKRTPSLKLYAFCSAPLAIAGFSSAVLRLSFPSEIELRTLLEQLSLLLGFILLVMGLIRGYSKNLETKKRKLVAYVTTPVLATLAFWIIIPIPL
ncbi:hypothetical protein [Thermococcus zilligii]|uniref:hypothetical protein n=1 Tax=Thermococcus zilligii TaxID=54076 RepID=UPI00029AC87E|nr:hypothetical protein [Thermococcus zilligii]